MKPKLSNKFGYGILLMAITGIFFIARDAVNDDGLYKVLATSGFVCAYLGFFICVVTMIRYWIDIYNHLKNNK